MTLLRSYADDLPLQDWLFKQVFPIEDKMDHPDTVITAAAVIEHADRVKQFCRRHTVAFPG